MVLCMPELTHRIWVEKVEPCIMFEELRSPYMRYNRMSSERTISEVTTSSAISLVRKNPLYRIIVETQHYMDTMHFDDFEARTSNFLVIMSATCLMRTRMY